MLNIFNKKTETEQAVVELEKLVEYSRNTFPDGCASVKLSQICIPYGRSMVMDTLYLNKSGLMEEKKSKVLGREDEKLLSMGEVSTVYYSSIIKKYSLSFKSIKRLNDIFVETYK